MNHRIVLRALIVLACAAGLVMGQRNKKKDQPPPQTQAAPAVPAGSPVAKQPQVKSQAEAQAVTAIVQAADPDSRIKAADDLVTKFNDSEFKSLALFFAAVSYQQKNDIEKMMVYAERTIEADPQNYQALLMLGNAIATRTREFDLDREEKLKSAEGYANKAIEILKTAPRPNPNITDDQWEGAKKDLVSQAHEIFANSAMARNQPDKAIEEYKTAIAGATEADPSTSVRLAAAYNKANKWDDAVATLDKVLAAPNLNPVVKKVASAERERSLQLKKLGAAPAK